MTITATSGPYPSMEYVFNLARININDTFRGATGTLGEGRVFTDDWTPIVNVLNQAIQGLQRDLELRGIQTTREQSFLISGLPPLPGGVADPSVVTYLSYDGYWNGAVLNATFKLPVNLLYPIKLRQRVTGGPTAQFAEIHEFPSALVSCDQSPYGLGGWRWFRDRINFNGSTTTIDVELDYYGTFTPFATTMDPADFSTTLVPFQDSADALAYKCAYIFCSPRLPKGAADGLAVNYQAAIEQMAARWLKPPGSPQ